MVWSAQDVNPLSKELDRMRTEHAVLVQREFMQQRLQR